MPSSVIFPPLASISRSHNVNEGLRRPLATYQSQMGEQSASLASSCREISAILRYSVMVMRRKIAKRAISVNNKLARHDMGRFSHRRYSVRKRQGVDMKLYLREWRKHRGLTLAELGEAVGKEQNTISRWERGLRNLNVIDLESLAEALVCTPYDLLYRNPDRDIDLFKFWADADDGDKETILKMLKGLTVPDPKALKDSA